MAALAFDVNVALAGLAAEAKAVRKAGEGHGPISSRADAMGTLERARAQVIEMEEEREKRRSITS